MKYKCQNCGDETDNDQSLKSINADEIVEIHRCDKCQERWDRELAWESKGETINESELICPYCNAVYHDYEAYDFDEGETEEEECSHCGRKFDVEVQVERLYSTKRSLCEMPDDWNEEDEE